MNKILICFAIIFFNLKCAYSEGYIKASDGIEWNSDKQTYTALGDVVFKNDRIEANSNKIIANYIEENNEEIFNVVEFFTNVLIYFNDELYKGDYAIYKKKDNTIQLKGNVSIKSPTRLLMGDELIVDLENNKRTLNSNTKETIVEVLIEKK